MRRPRSTRLLVIPTVALALLASSVVLAGPASAAKHKAPKPVTCNGINGTVGGSWTLTGCMPASITGGDFNGHEGAVSAAFPTSPATIQWNAVSNPVRTGLQTTISFSVIPRVGHKDRCRGGASEVVLSGTVTGNVTNAFSGAPIKIGRIKLFVCENNVTQALSSLKKLRL